MDANLVDINKLVRVSTYAKSKRNLSGKKVTAQTVYNWIEAGLLTEVKIDKVRFVQKNLTSSKSAA